MSGLANLFGSKGKAHEERMKGLMKLSKLKTIVNYAAMGKDGLSYKHKSDDNRMLIGFKNGVFDFRTGEFRDGCPEDFIFKIVPYDYEENPKAPTRFVRYLKSSFGYQEPKPRREFTKKDKDYKEKLARYVQDHKAWYQRKKEHESTLINFLQVLLGYILMGSGKERKFVILWGPEGNNGKTTLMNIICSIFGEYAVSIDPGILLSKKFDASSGSHTSHILDWQDRRFLFGDETESGKKIDTGFIKRASGNGEQVARGAHEKEMTRFRQTYTIVLLTNNLPYIPVDDSATWRRLVIVPFMWSFVESPSKPNEMPIDKNLEDDLKEEYPGIIKWIIDGAMIYKERQSLDIPEYVKNVAMGYREDSDPFKKFIDECFLFDDDYFTSARSAYNVYKAWCKDNSHHVVSEKKFAAHMMRLNLEKKDGRHFNMYLYVKLNPDVLDYLFGEDDRPSSERDVSKPKPVVDEVPSVEDVNRTIQEDAFAV